MQWIKRLPGDMINILTAFLTVLAVAALGSRLVPSGFSQGLVIVLCLLVAVWFALSPSNQSAPTWQRVGYLILQLLTISALIVAANGVSIVYSILFFIPASQSPTLFSKRGSFLWAGLISLLNTILQTLFRGESGLLDALPMIAGYFFFCGFAYVWVQTEAAKKEALMLKKIEELRLASLIDPLTGVGNRAYTDIMLKQSMDLYLREGIPFGILFMDIDHFKQVNDQYGHSNGDKTLRLVATTIRENIRSYDFVGRWGGEEFVVLVMDIQFKNLIHLAESLRQQVETTAIDLPPHRFNITVSIGATLAQPGEALETLIERADQLMYQSKMNGRNRVTAA